MSDLPYKILKMTGIEVPSVRMFIVLLVYLFAKTSYSLHEVCISPDGARQSCMTLNEFCQDPHSILNSACVTLLDGTHWLNTTCNVEYIEGKNSH